MCALVTFLYRSRFLQKNKKGEKMLKAIPSISKKILVISITALLLISMVFFISPGRIYADYSTFDNPNYTYSVVKSAPVGVEYKWATLSPDGTKIAASKRQSDGSAEIVLMNADGTGSETVISPGNSVANIIVYWSPFWSDDGTAIGFIEAHYVGSSKIMKYDVGSHALSYVYEPTSPKDVGNVDFLGNSTTSIIFWDMVGNASDLFIWVGSTLTNITNTPDYKEYEPVSNSDGTKILYWSGETVNEPINTVHTLTLSNGAWLKDQGFTPFGWTPISSAATIPWAFWSGRANNHIGVTDTSMNDLKIYDQNGTFLYDLTGSGYSGGADQRNYFGFGFEGPNGEYIITSNAGRTTSGRDIVKVTKASTTTASTPTFKPLTPEEIASLNLSIGQQIDLYGATNIGFTKMLYDNILGRVPDSEGADNWVTALNEGSIKLGDVIFGFVFSKELEGIISPATPEEFITFLYKNVFDRNPDPDGYNNWVSLMQNGMSKEDVLLHFTDSGEFKNICEMFGLKP